MSRIRGGGAYAPDRGPFQSCHADWCLACGEAGRGPVLPFGLSSVVSTVLWRGLAHQRTSIPCQSLLHAQVAGGERSVALFDATTQTTGHDIFSGNLYGRRWRESERGCSRRFSGVTEPSYRGRSAVLRRLGPARTRSTEPIALSPCPAILASLATGVELAARPQATRVGRL